MAVLPEIESKIFNALAHNLASLVESAITDNIEKDKLLFVSCLNESEKHQVSKSEIAKMQQELQKCNPDLAGYFVEILKPNSAEGFSDGYYDLRELLCKNFLLENIEDVNPIIEIFEQYGQDVHDEESEIWHTILNIDGLIIDEELKNEFIQYLAMASRLDGFLEYHRENVNDNSDNATQNINKTFETSKSLSNLSVNEFFHSIEETNISNIEILNYTEKITDNFKLEKLKLLLDEFEMHLSLRKEEKESEFSDDDISNAINEITSKGKEIPYLKFSESAKKLFNVSENFIDLEKLLFPYDLFRLYQFRNLLNSKVKEVQSTNQTKDSTVNKTESFETILTPEKAIFILKMLEDLSITVNGKSILSERKKSALRGVVEACSEKNILPKLSIDKLCNLFATKINLELKAKLDFSETAKNFKKQSISYIEKHYNN